MLNRIFDFFVFASSSKEEARRIGRWLRIILRCVLGIFLLYAIVVYYLKFDLDTLIFIGVFFIIFASLLVLTNQGRVRLVSLLFPIFSLLGMLIAAYRFGGIRSASYNALVIVIIISALFLRGRITTIFTIISILAGLGLLLAEIQGNYKPDLFFLNPLASWLASVMTFTIAAILLGITARQVRSAIRRTTTEVIERRRTEQSMLEKNYYLAALHETAMGIINRLDLVPMLDLILTKAEDLAGTQHSYIEMLMPDKHSLKQIVGHGIFTKFAGELISLGHGLSSDVVITGQSKVIQSYPSWPDRLAVYAEAGFETIAAMPLITNGEVIGVIGLAHTHPEKNFSTNQLEILNQFAELAALSIQNARLYQDSQDELAERQRAQEALVRSEENLQLALSAARMGTWEWDLNKQTIHWSDTVYDIFSVTPSDFTGSFDDYLALAHPSDRQKLKSRIENSVLHPEQDFSVEHRILLPGNNIRWLEGRGKIRLDESGKPAGMAGTVTDITERKTAEHALKKANQQLKKDTQVLERRSTLLQVAAEVSRAASAILDPDSLGQEVVNLVHKRFKLYYVGLFLIDKSGNSALLRAATGKAGHKMLSTGHQLDVAPTSMVGWSIANRQARIALDVGEDAVRFNNPSLPLTRSELALPLISRGQILGAITIQSKEEAAFSPEDIETFQTMVDQLANAILNARFYNQLELELEERRRAEEAVRLLNSELEMRVRLRTADLQASEEKFRALSENNPLQISCYDQDARYLYVNRVGRNDLFVPEDIIGKKLRDVLTNDAALVEFSEACIRQVFETGKTLNTEYALDNYYALWSLAPEFGPNGEVTSVITSTMDITERKRIEEELRQRSLELQAANRELEAFSYSVSHDLRAPLRAIDGFSRILMQDYKNTLPPDAGQHLQRISAASLHMGQLIDDILRLSRVTRAELHANTIDLSALAESILAELRAENPERHVTTEIQPGLLAKGDERLLRVALENLLSNAWKFTTKIESALIRVGQECIETDKAFYISDNGVGFDMAYADKLFGAFQRLHTTDEFPGTGIGLAIVQRVIHKHGGRIWAQAEKNKGATFYFTL